MIECPKCSHEHEPTGSHEDDEGDWECEECKFEFEVEIEYDPSYSESCKVHDYGDYKFHETVNGKFEARICNHCQHCELRE